LQQLPLTPGSSAASLTLVTRDGEHLERLVLALEAIELAAAGNIARSREVQARTRLLRDGLGAGGSLVEWVEAEKSPRMVELLSANKESLETVGAELRAAQAAALRVEGLTIEAIAELFGVTRQRISALLRRDATG